ncbi:phage/plasmid primase, P4 family [Lachnospiraceae bacterium 46-61]
MKELKKIANWVCHRNKIPIDPRTGKPAKSNDRSTWGTYTQAKAYMGADKSISGLGFMFSHSSYVGIDIDHCITDRKLSDFAKQVIKSMNSYTELSPSGTGIHIICKGELLGAGRKNSDLGLEMYDSGRYFTVTEKALKGYDTVQYRQNEIEMLYQKYFDVPKKEHYIQQTLQQNCLEDDKIIEIAGKSQNGSKFLDLYTGNWQGYYKSQSEADLSFCNMLAFWTGCDDVQMDRIFRASGLMREKWSKKHGINTYGDMTITKAIDCCDTVYQPTKNVSTLPNANQKVQTLSKENLQCVGQYTASQTESAQNDFKHINNVETHTALQQYTYGDNVHDSGLHPHPQTFLQKSLTKNSELGERNYMDCSLDRFHKFNAKGNITGVFDAEIMEYIIQTENIVVVGDCAYLYQNGVYNIDRKGSHIKNIIQNLIYKEYQNSRTINRIYDLIMIQPCLRKSYTNMNQYPDYYINFQNGMLNVQTMEMLPHSPEYFSMNQIPHEYKALTKSDLENFPYSQHFLKTSFHLPDVNTIFQYMGICLTNTILYQVFLLLLGEGANGKSIMIDILNAVIGEQNTSNLSMDKLAERFFSSQLLFKLCNTCADISKISIDDDAELKKIIGGDIIQAEFKGKDSFSFRPYAKMLFSANRFPYVDDRSEGFKRRLRVIEMNKKPPKKDVHLKQKIMAELDFWIFTAVQGLREVLNNHDIFESDNSKKMREDIYKNGDSVYSFIKDCLQPQQEHNIRRSEMFQEYEKYCQYYERVRVKKKTFFEELKAKGFTIKRDREGFVIYENIALTVWREEENIFFKNK